MTRDEAITRLHNIMGFDYHYLPADDAEAMDMAIEALQQPEIIRCKDCKYATKQGYINWCDKVMCYGVDDWFCASARRKENES